MGSPAQQHPDTLGQTLAQIVSDHEKRLRKVERVLWAVAGAVSGSTGTWVTFVLTRR